MVPTRDIVVVGAGVVGCAVAFELTRRGRTVALLDAREPGAGATQASGGMLAPFSEAADGGPLLELGARSLGLFDDFIATLEAGTGMPVGYRRTGTLHAARVPESLQAFERTVRTLASMGVAAQLLSAAESRVMEPHLTERVLGGMLIPSQGLVSAPEMTRAMLAAAVQGGSTVLAPARVRRVSACEGGVAIDTDGAPILARTVVLATGAWSGQVAIEGATPAVPVEPVRGQLLHLGWQGEPLSRITWDERCYLVPRTDGTLLVGATVEDAGFDERTTVAGIRTLLDAVCELIPEARRAAVLSTRAGLRPRSPDPLPIVGWSQAVPGLMYATGHYRNGVLLAPLTARLVAGAMVDGTRDGALELMRPSRFGTI